MRGKNYNKNISMKSNRRAKKTNKLIFIAPIVFILAIVLLINICNGNIQKLTQQGSQEALKAGSSPVNLVLRDELWNRNVAAETFTTNGYSFDIAAQLQDATTNAIMDNLDVLITTSNADIVKLSTTTGTITSTTGATIKSGTAITLVPVGNGTARIGFNYLGNATYAAAYAYIDVTVSAQTLVVEPQGYTGYWDAAAHGISLNTMPSDATKVYGETDGIYTSTESPTYSTGTHIVYYKVSKPGYLTKTGLATVKINPSPVTYKIYDLVHSGSDEITNSMSMDTEEGANSTKISVSRYTYSNDKVGPEVGGLTVTSSDSNIVSVEVENGGYRLYARNPGTATLTISQAANECLQAKTQNIQVTVSGTLKVTAYSTTYEYDEQDHTISFECETSGATTKFGIRSGTYDLDEIPKYKTGTHTVYYQVTKQGYPTVTGSKTH